MTTYFVAQLITLNFQFPTSVLLVAVAFLWGATNPLIRRGSVGVEDIKEATVIRQFFGELFFLITRWQASI